MILPMLVPTMKSIGILCFSKAFKTPICEIPRAPPPLRISATRGCRSGRYGMRYGIFFSCSLSCNRTIECVCEKTTTEDRTRKVNAKTVFNRQYIVVDHCQPQQTYKKFDRNAIRQQESSEPIGRHLWC